MQDGADLYRLKERRDDLLQIERLGEKSVDSLLASIEASKQRPLAQRAGGARHSSRRRRGGGDAGQALREHGRAHGGSRRSRSRRSRASAPRSPRASSSGSRSTTTSRMVEKLRAAGVNLREEKGGRARGAALRPDLRRDGPAGALLTRRRGVAAQAQRRRGREQREQEDELLVVGEDAGSKLAKAQQVGTPLLDEDGFVALLTERGVET